MFVYKPCRSLGTIVSWVSMRGMDTQRPTLNDLLNGPAVLTIAEAGRFFGYGRTASYAAAKRGVIPTVLVGEVRRVVPAAALARALGASRDDLVRSLPEGISK